MPSVTTTFYCVFAIIASLPLHSYPSSDYLFQDPPDPPELGLPEPVQTPPVQLLWGSSPFARQLVKFEFQPRLAINNTGNFSHTASDGVFISFGEFLLGLVEIDAISEALKLTEEQKKDLEILRTTSKENRESLNEFRQGAKARTDREAVAKEYQSLAREFGEKINGEVERILTKDQRRILIANLHRLDFRFHGVSDYLSTIPMFLEDLPKEERDRYLRANRGLGDVIIQIGRMPRKDPGKFPQGMVGAWLGEHLPVEKVAKISSLYFQDAIGQMRNLSLSELVNIAESERANDISIDKLWRTVGVIRFDAFGRSSREREKLKGEGGLQIVLRNIEESNDWQAGMGIQEEQIELARTLRKQLSDQELTDEEFLAKLEKVLLPHQIEHFQVLTERREIDLYGFFVSLTSGRLGKRFELTTKEQNDLRNSGKRVAEEFESSMKEFEMEIMKGIDKYYESRTLKPILVATFKPAEINLAKILYRTPAKKE